MSEPPVCSAPVRAHRGSTEGIAKAEEPGNKRVRDYSWRRQVSGTRLQDALIIVEQSGADSECCKGAERSRPDTGLCAHSALASRQTLKPPSDDHRANRVDEPCAELRGMSKRRKCDAGLEQPPRNDHREGGFQPATQQRQPRATLHFRRERVDGRTGNDPGGAPVLQARAERVLELRLPSIIPRARADRALHSSSLARRFVIYGNKKTTASLLRSTSATSPKPERVEKRGQTSQRTSHMRESQALSHRINPAPHSANTAKSLTRVASVVRRLFHLARQRRVDTRRTTRLKAVIERDAELRSSPVHSRFDSALGHALQMNAHERKCAQVASRLEEDEGHMGSLHGLRSTSSLVPERLDKPGGCVRRIAALDVTSSRASRIRREVSTRIARHGQTLPVFEERPHCTESEERITPHGTASVVRREVGETERCICCTRRPPTSLPRLQAFQQGTIIPGACAVHGILGLKTEDESRQRLRSTSSIVSERLNRRGSTIVRSGEETKESRNKSLWAASMPRLRTSRSRQQRPRTSIKHGDTSTGIEDSPRSRRTRSKPTQAEWLLSEPQKSSTEDQRGVSEWVTEAREGRSKCSKREVVTERASQCRCSSGFSECREWVPDHRNSPQLGMKWIRGRQIWRSPFSVYALNAWSGDERAV
ncbi:hypothetical protein K438DRAFT_1772432 [Mycena galopus ATCC 62051]|nr:hypothetical protein K438DRAFT_1772432 [Mycena galopus ATCC 62051]